MLVSNERYFPLQVSNNVGSKESDGWSIEGMTEVSRLKNVSLIARAKPESRALEERFLGVLRDLDPNAAFKFINFTPGVAKLDFMYLPKAPSS
jgi:hypothetical protein